MTQVELAKRLGVRPATVSEWESGKTRPTRANVGAVAAVLGVPESELLRAPAVVGEAMAPYDSRSAARFRRAESFEREMVRLGADDFEADFVRVRSRNYIESILSSGGTETEGLSDDDLDRELEAYLSGFLRTWVREHMKARGAVPNLDGTNPKKRR